MGLIDYDSPLISIDLPDWVDSDTVIKRKAVFDDFGHGHARVGKSASLNINLWVEHYANVSGGYGRHLHSFGVADRAVQLKSDANTLMDVATGQILAMRQNLSDEEWDILCNSFEQDTMIQTKYFLWLRDTQNINVRGLLLVNMQAGIAMGKYD